SAVIDTHAGDENELNAISVAPFSDKIDADNVQRIEVDTLAVSGGWSQAVHLHSGRRGNIAWNAQLQGFVAVDSVEGTHLAGALTGKHSTALALSSGAGAGAAAATAAGFPTEAQVSGAIDRPYGPVAPLWLVPSPDGEDTKNYHNHYVDLQ